AKSSAWKPAGTNRAISGGGSSAPETGRLEATATSSQASARIFASVMGIIEVNPSEAYALRETGGSREQEQAGYHHDGANASRHALAGRGETFGGDGRSYH